MISDAPTPPERDALIADAETWCATHHVWPTGLLRNCAQMLRADAEEIATLKAALEDIASGELGINVAIKHARRTLEKTPDA